MSESNGPKQPADDSASAALDRNRSQLHFVQILAGLLKDTRLKADHKVVAGLMLVVGHCGYKPSWLVNVPEVGYATCDGKTSPLVNIPHWLLEDSRLKSNDKLVGMLILAKLDGRKPWRICVGTLAWEASLDVQSVRRCIKRLIAADWFRRVPNPDAPRENLIMRPWTFAGEDVDRN